MFGYSRASNTALFISTVVPPIAFALKRMSEDEVVARRRSGGAVTVVPFKPWDKVFDGSQKPSNYKARLTEYRALRQRATAYREALEERTRERVPPEWATTQSNLGNALRGLGERESDTARLKEAITAYREALKERTRERVPLDWAATQNNMGIALCSLGVLERNKTFLEEAVEAFEPALDVFEKAGASYYIQVARQGLARVRKLLEE